jgi:hypothetical protein
MAQGPFPKIRVLWFKVLPFQTQVRGFAPFGMMECWNIGILGTGIMQY